ncbi:MAG TPA: hypothetical protein VGZ32_04550 [Actinocrinis sp.]|uniref:hypothetical protein n=1 Tax=Actinocrinis sp. TaxID=1920516 RepID=UPI002DDD8026|nr:hypothetical protein [Actinocrinis sp.]HEV3169581.1 hypothetical protein [Actinocrinis sp.]
MKISTRRWWPAAALAAATAGVLATVVPAGANAAPAAQTTKASGESTGLGPLSGLLPRDHLTLESALQINLSNETARLPLYPGIAYKGTSHEEKVWYVLLDASDAGAADDLGVNYAPKLANIAIGDPAAVQTVTLENPTPKANPFGPAVLDFAGAPDFSPTRIAVPGPNGFPLAEFQPGAVAGPGYSPFIKIAGSDTVYDAPIVATGDGPFDVTTHTDTGDRVLGVHIAGPSKPGQFAESWVDMLFVKGFDAGQPIVYISTDAGQPLTAVLERATYVPALNDVSFNGGDDFLGSARERLFGFVNGQTGVDNPNAQGFQHLALDGMVGKDASLSDPAFINALRNGGDLLNVFGDFPTLTDPRHSKAYSPLWDAQLGLWTPKAIKEGLDTRQIDENQVFNLAATRPDLLTGVDPATGQPEPYGSVGVDIDCAVLGYINQPPTANLADPAPNSQFPPR